MYRDIVLIGIGIYGLILAIGFSILASAGRKKKNVKKEIYRRIIESAVGMAETYDIEQPYTPLAVRTVDRERNAEKKAEAFPFLTDPKWTDVCVDTVALESEAAETVLLPVREKETAIF